MSRAGSGLARPVSSIRVTPPMGSRMMERTAMPLRCATTACASSCSTTHPKMMPTSASPRPGPETPMFSDSENHTKPSRNRNVMWMRMSTPNSLPAGNDQPLMQCACLYLYSIHSFYREEAMRIIAGAYRSRPLKSLPGLDLRPTSDRLRETLFNVLASSSTLEAACGSTCLPGPARWASRRSAGERARCTSSSRKGSTRG